MNTEKLKEFVLKNPDLVSVKQSKKYPDLFVVKYNKKVFWDDLWTPELELCRGLVVDKDWNIVVRPFNKIYNYGIEDRAPKFHPTEYVRAYRKVNGFMAALTYTEDYGLIISTTGSLDSEYCKMIEESLEKYFTNGLDVTLNQVFDTAYTHLFECVHPNDSHIIPEFPGMYYLGSTSTDLFENRVFHDDNVAKNFDMIDTIYCTIQELQDHVKTVKHEGYVFYNKDGLVSKIKSPYYLINKFFARKNVINGFTSDKAKRFFDEEFYPLIDYIKKDQEYFTNLSEQDRLLYIRKYLQG